MAGRSALALALATLLPTVSATANQPATSASWLDRPLAGWNTAGSPMPRAPTAAETSAAIVNRCRLMPPRATPAELAVEAAGWIPFWNVDQQLVRDDVEIVGGMREADGMCRPLTYNLFVFVGGRFAGTLSPTPMTSRVDGSSGVVRMALPIVIAEFARYKETDALCCPSGRIAVRYRIDRTAAGPVLIPVETRTTR